jgi:Sulfotransferase domain
LPVLFDKTFGVARDVKVYLKIYLKIKSKRRQLSQIKTELRAMQKQAKELITVPERGVAERTEYRKRKKRTQQEIFLLEREILQLEEEQLRVAKAKRTEDTSDDRPAPQMPGGPATGALPDFVIIGAKKCGTTFLYNLLTRHPHVEPAAKKELHYFDILFEDESTEWYRRCFPQSRWKDGRRTITGEATPYFDYSANRSRRYPLAPERMAQVLPQARLIVLLRNPVDRAYSDYQQAVRKGRETRTFEEAIGLEEGVGAQKKRPLGEEGEDPEREDRVSLDDRCWYLDRSVYVNYLLHWSRFFGDEQMLVLKSEAFFERPREGLKLVLDFLDLPDWEPGASQLNFEKRARNKGEYERKMDPATRQQLEEYFEPHNQRLYEYLGEDFGW